MITISEEFLSPEFKKKIILEKHAQLPQLLQNLGIDCWIIFVRETGTNPDAAMEYVVGNDVVGKSAFIFSLKANKLKKISIVANFDANTEREKGIWDEVIGYLNGFKDYLVKKIQEINPNKIALNFSTEDPTSDGLTHGMFLLLKQYLHNFEDRFISAQNIISAIQGIKTPTEIKLIRKACQITEDINKNMTSILQIGQSETEIQKKFQLEVAKHQVGYSWQKDQNPAIDCSVEKEYGHVFPSPKNLTKKGLALHNDFGIRYHGYCSDLQRMWFFGSKDELPEELRRGLNTIVKAIEMAAEAIKPGKLGYEIDKVSRDYVISQGYEEFKHALGHQVGLRAHDGGNLIGPLWERYGSSPKQPLQIGQVFTLEPSLKTQNHGMIAMEEMIVVTETGCDFLVPPKKDFIFVTFVES